MFGCRFGPGKALDHAGITQTCCVQCYLMKHFHRLIFNIASPRGSIMNVSRGVGGESHPFSFLWRKPSQTFNLAQSSQLCTQSTVSLFSQCLPSVCVCVCDWAGMNDACVTSRRPPSPHALNLELLGSERLGDACLWQWAWPCSLHYHWPVSPSVAFYVMFTHYWIHIPNPKSTSVNQLGAFKVNCVKD